MFQRKCISCIIWSLGLWLVVLSLGTCFVWFGVDDVLDRVVVNMMVP